MRVRTAIRAALLVLAAAPATAQAKGDWPDLAELKKATAECRPFLEAARAAKRSSPEAKRAVKAGIAPLRPYAKTMRKVFARESARPGDHHWFYAYAFNELLTLGEYHKSRVREEYIGRWIGTGKGYMQMLMPARGQWGIKFHADEEQHCSTLTQKDAKGRIISKVQVHRYKWNTLYSGVGGENARKLADDIRELDLESAKEDGDKCSSVKVKKFSKHLPRSHYYRVTYKDPKIGFAIIRDEHYVKGDRATFNIVVVSYRQELQDADAFAKWQSTEQPELKWMLSTMRNWE
ncbi:MAG: hypothetical protein GY946_30575 [bacterium]|nr:hypothetical protein [bacterium]